MSGCAMRNWLARAYLDINLNILWNVVQNLAGLLSAQLEAIPAIEDLDCSEQE
ncbi:MAG: hypothetical protein OXI77_00590 [Chloroflexota bacterium]|nr:hypothetical protein [Chloroflexota bacterium]